MNESIETSPSCASCYFPVQTGSKGRLGRWERICSYLGPNSFERPENRSVSWLMWDGDLVLFLSLCPYPFPFSIHFYVSYDSIYIYFLGGGPKQENYC